MENPKLGISIELGKFPGRWSNPYKTYSLTSIGECRLCELTSGHMIEMQQLLKQPIADCSPKEFVDVVLRSLLRKTEYSSGPSLTIDDINSISASKKELIIDDLLKNSDALYHHITPPKKISGDAQILNEVNQKAISPRISEESAIDYYHRLTIFQQKSQRETFQKLFKSLNFSNSINESITNSIRGLDEILNPLKSISKTLNFDRVSEHFAPSSTKTDLLFDLNKISPPALRTQDVIAEIRANHQNSLVVVAEISKTLIGMLNEMKGATNDTNTSLRIAIASLILTIVMGAPQFYSSIFDISAEQTQKMFNESLMTSQKLLRQIKQFDEQKAKQNHDLIEELKKLNQPSSHFRK